ncbi:MAG: VanW family protein [Microvirga sp.]|jgi:vancomycin resistance protein VanW
MIRTVRRTLREAIPEPVRLRIALAHRGVRDRWSGVAESIVRAAVEPPAPFCAAAAVEIVAVNQPIRHTAHTDGKVHNLRLAASLLDGVAVPPARVFSFWALVGPPAAERGFRLGRSIRGDVLQAEVGGGLCQISGLAYELGLRAGMAVIERHPHTKDLYNEETRFTPLGLDATVVWGHKDLRLRNTLPEPVVFAFAVGPEAITGRILAPRPFPPTSIAIERRDCAASPERLVRVFRSLGPDEVRLISVDRYVAAVTEDNAGDRDGGHAQES